MVPSFAWALLFAFTLVDSALVCLTGEEINKQIDEGNFVFGGRPKSLNGESIRFNGGGQLYNQILFSMPLSYFDGYLDTQNTDFIGFRIDMTGLTSDHDIFVGLHENVRSDGATFKDVTSANGQVTGTGSIPSFFVMKLEQNLLLFPENDAAYKVYVEDGYWRHGMQGGSGPTFGNNPPFDMSFTVNTGTGTTEFEVSNNAAETYKGTLNLEIDTSAGDKWLFVSGNDKVEGYDFHKICVSTNSAAELKEEEVVVVTAESTRNPSTSPSMSPSNSPTTSPSRSPSNSPTTSPSTSPSASPTASPTEFFTDAPTTDNPTAFTTSSPSNSPTTSPSTSPSVTATTGDSDDGEGENVEIHFIYTTTVSGGEGCPELSPSDFAHICDDILPSAVTCVLDGNTLTIDLTYELDSVLGHENAVNGEYTCASSGLVFSVSGDAATLETALDDTLVSATTSILAEKMSLESSAFSASGFDVSIVDSSEEDVGLYSNSLKTMVHVSVQMLLIFQVIMAVTF